MDTHEKIHLKVFGADKVWRDSNILGNAFAMNLSGMSNAIFYMKFIIKQKQFLSSSDA